MNRRSFFKRVAILVPGVAFVKAISRLPTQVPTRAPAQLVGTHYDLLIFDDRCCHGLRNEAVFLNQIYPAQRMYCSTCLFRRRPQRCAELRCMRAMRDSIDKELHR